jgi:hypothetical protein
MIRNWGFILLAIWLILWGAIQILSLSFSGLWIVMGVLAIVSGILILLGK